MITPVQFSTYTQAFSSARLRAASARLVHRIAHRAGYELVRSADYEVVAKGSFDIVRHDYYSPVPDVANLPTDVWTRRSELGGLEFDLPKAMGFIESELRPYVTEIDVPISGNGVPGEFFLKNDNFEAVDAELLYTMIRALRPARIVELGSGFTTLLINLACRRIASEGGSTSHTAFDPYPRAHILGDAPLTAPSVVKPVPATEVPMQVFEELEAGDVLFVDTTHTVKLGSDVNFIVLDVLPRLAEGVYVHFHDIFLPWEYPRRWFTEMDYFWAEQYVLQAFLAFNRAFEVVVPAHALSREYPDRLSRSIPSFREGAAPGSMWLRRLPVAGQHVVRP
jgi:hypothetical protein